MLFRDLLLAFPGLLSPITMPSRPDASELPKLTLIASAKAPTLSNARQPAMTTTSQSTPPEDTAIDYSRNDSTTTSLSHSQKQSVQYAASTTSAPSLHVVDLEPATTITAPEQVRTTSTTSSALPKNSSSQGLDSLMDRWTAAHPGNEGSGSTQIPPNPIISQVPGEIDPPSRADLHDGLQSAFDKMEVELANVGSTSPRPPIKPEPNPGDDDTSNPEPPTDPEEPTTPTLPEGNERPAQTFQVEAEAGRVTVIEPKSAGSIAEVRILSQGEHGHASVNPDNTISLVLSENPGNTDALSFTYEITYKNGDTRQVTSEVAVKEGQQAAGWSLGDHYMLQENTDGSLHIETGDNHRKLYLTNSEDGLTLAEIAQQEGVAVNKITVEWLQKHPEYGGSEDMALNAGEGVKLWYHLISAKNGPTSNWLLLERGYEYDELNRLVGRGAEGESALHPVVIGAYGTGDAPIVNDMVRAYQETSKHIVVRDIHMKGGFQALQGENIILDHLFSTVGEINVQNVDRFTMHNITVMDSFYDAPVGDPAIWQAHLNRKSGAYIQNSNGVLIEGNLFDHNGWQDGYSYDLDGSKPQPPSYYSHNFYLDHGNRDLTLRDNITMRAASFGAQVRSGGFIEDNVFIDNNAAVNFLGGDYMGLGPVGHYTLFMGNLITSAGHKRVSDKEGALSMGVEDHARQSSLVDNIIAHLADPNNAKEQSDKTVTHNALRPGENTYFDDTIIYNWLGSANKSPLPDQGIAGLDRNVLDETTIQQFTAKLLGKNSATIADLANVLRDQAKGKLDHIVDADIINAFFQKGFGLQTDLRDTETTLRFTPDARGEGVRWDNRLNWSTNDLPGTQNGDSVDLGGNRVIFGAQTVQVDNFVFGEFGRLKVSSGRLDITGEVSVADKGNALQITNAGQVWMSGYRDADMLRIHAEGGRFANTGDFAGRMQLAATKDAQVILADAGASMDLKGGSLLAIHGRNTKVGFDGDDNGSAVLRLQNGSTLKFAAAADGFGKISEFRSGAYGEFVKVTSGVKLDGTLRVDLAPFEGTKARSFTLIDADQIIGNFDEIKFDGLGSKRDALIRIDYVRDEVILVLGEEGKGSGQIRTNTIGDQDFIDYTKNAALHTLWDDLHDTPLAALNDPLNP